MPDRTLTLRHGEPVRPPCGAAALLDPAPAARALASRVPAHAWRGPAGPQSPPPPVPPRLLPVLPSGPRCGVACGVTCWAGLLAEETRALASSSRVTVPSAAPKLELGERVFRDRGTPCAPVCRTIVQDTQERPHTAGLADPGLQRDGPRDAVSRARSTFLSSSRRPCADGHLHDGPPAPARVTGRRPSGTSCIPGREGRACVNSLLCGPRSRVPEALGCGELRQPWGSGCFFSGTFPVSWTGPAVTSLVMHLVFLICKMETVALASSCPVPMSAATTLRSRMGHMRQFGWKSLHSPGPDQRVASRLHPEHSAAQPSRPGAGVKGPHRPPGHPL